MDKTTITNSLKICVTGAAGQIAYSLIPLLANGDIFGQRKLNLSLLDIPSTINSLETIQMELEDCAFPLVESITFHSNPDTAFTDCDIVIFIGGFPRKAGMERKDLLAINGKIFQEQGRALDKFAKKTVKCLVVANPANTNCLILHSNAPSIPKDNFSALSRLDQNRAVSLLANISKATVADIKNILIWGNHSSTMYPDVNHGSIGNKSVRDLIQNETYLNDEFIRKVQNRGAEIIQKKKSSSVFSAAHAAKDHLKDWYCGTKSGEFVSMGVVSAGEYNIPKGIVFSFPVQCESGFGYKVIENLKFDEFSKLKIEQSLEELVSEKEDAKDFILL